VKNRRTKKRHLIMDVKENQPVTVYDLFSRFDIELRVFHKDAGRLAIDFNVPGSMRIARGNNGG